MPAMLIKAVLFDLFETILLVRKDENRYRNCLKKLHEALMHDGVSASFRDFEEAYFKARNKLYMKVKDNLEEPHFSFRISLALHEIGYDYNVDHPTVRKAVKAFSDEFMRYIYLDEDAYEVLQTLHGKYKTGIVSNFAIPECARELISIHGLQDFLDIIIISAEINKRKPDPEIFNVALSSLSVKPKDAVFVGDTLHVDVMGAKRVGMKTVLIERGTEDLYNAEIKPDITIKRLRDLLAIIDCQN